MFKKWVFNTYLTIVSKTIIEDFTLYTLNNKKELNKVLRELNQVIKRGKRYTETNFINELLDWRYYESFYKMMVERELYHREIKFLISW